MGPRRSIWYIWKLHNYGNVYIGSKTAYHDLIQILLHPQFDKNHLVTNLQMLKKYQKKPPLMQIRSHKVPINARNTLSTTKNFTKAYYFSLIEYLHRILKNPNISSHLYFGSGILSESCEEFGIPQNLFSLERELQAQEWFLVEETDPLPNSTMLVLKFFLDLYYDEFGTFRNMYHSLGGVYLQIDFIKPFIEEVKKLEQGFIINLNGIDHWVTGGLGIVTLDLPQGNNNSGTLRHNTYRGCQICKATKDQFTNLLFDIYYHDRYHQITDQEFQYINQQTSKNAQSRLCSQYGLRPLPGPLDLILHDRHLHVPQDAYHTIAGKAAKEVFSLTIQRSNGYSCLQTILNNEHNALINLFPNSFQNLPNLHISHHLVDSARQYATCINTAVGIKEMVYRIFKAIVPHTNKRNLELTLLQQINTLQTLRHFVDGGIDNRMPHYSTRSIFTLLIIAL
ncbi:hypothetical protein C2G38_2152485 [Gigaspora rosea]|uniref:Uncharacterized protein n=1 Tax=Gigaspora rosea TaxID=44941 RepID=A0A397W756_9GLOM|nr:hypothetical protein C2G38_2152485 [Gigaspora rosea]